MHGRNRISEVLLLIGMLCRKKLVLCRPLQGLALKEHGFQGFTPLAIKLSPSTRAKGERFLLSLICIIVGIAGIAVGGERAELSFGAMADVQYCDHNSIGSTCYRSAKGKLEAAVVDLNRQKPDFVVQLGDFVDRDFKTFDVMMPIYDRLIMPHYHVLGNHDWGTKAGAEKHKVPERFGLANPYYDFKYGQWRFVVLNSSDISISGCAEGSAKYIEAQKTCEQFKKAGKPNGVPWGAAIGKEQLDWFKAVLKRAADSNERVIVFAHHTLLPWTESRLWNADEVIEIMEKSGCFEAYLCGHDHRGAYVCQNGIHYFTLDGMVETPDKNAYAVFELYRDRIEVKGFGQVKSRTVTKIKSQK